MPLDDPPPNRFASDTDGATARAEDTTMAAAKNRFFIANPFVETVFITNRCMGSKPAHKPHPKPERPALELWQPAKFRSAQPE
ncbi:MAG: hypothetical protein MUF08_16345 [Burkholderiaceae bacterium]|nr:hypothetical protein [Burkholderiaceae bacterium]